MCIGENTLLKPCQFLARVNVYGAEYIHTFWSLFVSHEVSVLDLPLLIATATGRHVRIIIIRYMCQ